MTGQREHRTIQHGRILSATFFYYFLQVVCGSQIVSINDASYSRYFRNHPFTIVKVYAPWCVRSIHLGPQYETAVHEVTSRISDLVEPINVSFTEIDGSTNPLFSSDWKFEGLPLIAIVSNNGKSVQLYNGDRTGHSIANWILRTIPPPVKHLKSKYEIESWTSFFSPVYVAYLQSSQKSTLSLIESVASQRKNIALFISVIDPEMTELQLQVFRQDEGHVATLNDMANVHSIEQFVDRESIPLIDRISSDNYKFYFDDKTGDIKIPLVWFIQSGNEDNSILNRLRVVAKSFRNQIYFVSIPVNLYRDHVWASLSVSESPTLIFQGLKHKIYEFSGSIVSADVHAIEQFVQSALENQLTRLKHRSQALSLPTNSRIFDTSESVLATDVISIVADNFESNVFNNDRDTLIVVLAPWGLLNLNLEMALYEYSSTIYSKSNKLQQQLKLFKIDGTRNDIQQFDGFEIARFPSMFYLPAKSKIPFRFCGPETVDGIGMFVDRAFHRDFVAPILVQD